MLNYPQAWTRVSWHTWLLASLSLLFWMTLTTRRALYRLRLLRSERVGVPVIVVGNISIGGTGKTPLVLWLVARLRAAGHVPGVILRGYGGTRTQPCAVQADSATQHCGDEAVLLARRTAGPVWIGKDRPATARALLAAHPACTVIISDDGLQHYRLARDIEIAVVDAGRGNGNGWLLPAGPLREPQSRLQTVDAIVVRGGNAPEVPQTTPPRYAMTYREAGWRNLLDPTATLALGQLQGKRVHAVAGIGNPGQFFDTLTQLGITHTPHGYADHHAFTADHIRFQACDAVVMTEKDAVKCERFADHRHWVLQIEAQVDDALAQQITERLSRIPRTH